MTKAIIQLLRNRAVRTMITEICVGIAVAVVATLNRSETNEKRKQFLLCMPKRPCNNGDDRQEKEVRRENKGNTPGQERKSWDRKRSYERNYM